ncbi:helix-turn-helix domain-containing protein [Dactylosporangium salmoneum]|uniref:Helix-turn-helix domain-containing protein n=1 Tax=Dactylosporangium salmoneum TaxID=53361 RepID=A0ABN3FCT8_9ACTN
MTTNAVTPQDYDRVRELHGQGLSRNEIARQLGRSGRTISRIAAELGLSFERAGATAAATEAKKADGAARRAQLQLDALEASQKLLGQMFAPATVYNFGGKENTYEEMRHPEPPFRDKQSIAAAIAALTSTALRLAEYDKATGSEEEKGMLLELRDQLRAARDASRGQQ